MSTRKRRPTNVLLAVMSIGAMLAVPGLAAGSAAPTAPIAVSQTTGDLSQALAGLRPLHFRPGTPPRGVRVITVDDSRRYQTMQGFGAAMTDSSAWLIWNELPPRARRALMKALFGAGPAGIAISYLRVPIGASDFTRAGVPYSYDDLPAGETDPTLTDFSIAHDEPYILPALRAVRALNPAVTMLASPWSPPSWMKFNDSPANSGPILGTLRPADYRALANYFVRFLKAYATAHVPIQAVTPQNEPEQLTNYPGMDLSERQESLFIAADLGPALRAADLHPEILGYDYFWSCLTNLAAVPCDTNYAAELARPSQTRSDLAGIAWHCYAGNANQMSAEHALAPRLLEVVDECSSGISPGPPAQLEIASARNWASGVLLWNIALDPQGGPVEPPDLGCMHCTGLVTVNPATHAFSLGRDYYQLGQASRYVPPGAVRIASNTFVTNQNTVLLKPEPGGYTTPGLDDVAFLDPNATRVLVAYNSGGSPAHFAVRWRQRFFTYTLPPAATVTFRWAPPRPHRRTN